MSDPGKSLSTRQVGLPGLSWAEKREMPESTALKDFRSDRQPVLAPEMELCLSELVRYYRHSWAGRRVTGILHNLNTPLQVISFHSELLAQKGEEEQALLSCVEGEKGRKLQALQSYRAQKLRKLQSEAEHLQTQVQNLLTQGLHEDQEELVCLDLNRLIQTELDLFQTDLFYKHQVEKIFSFCEDLPPLSGIYIDVAQSLRNLVENALEAMTMVETRALRIETRWEEGRRLILVGDTGPGVPREILPRLFEPFVTSKSAAGKPRAGLGLFMTRRLLAPYQAQFRVQSTSEGTVVTVVIPQKKTF